MKTIITFTGKWDDPTDTYFTGKKNVTCTGDVNEGAEYSLEESYNIGIPIEELFSFRELLRNTDDEVTIKFVLKAIPEE